MSSVEQSDETISAGELASTGVLAASLRVISAMNLGLTDRDCYCSFRCNSLISSEGVLVSKRFCLQCA